GPANQVRKTLARPGFGLGERSGLKNQKGRPIGRPINFQIEKPQFEDFSRSVDWTGDLSVVAAGALSGVAEAVAVAVGLMPCGTSTATSSAVSSWASGGT